MPDHGKRSHLNAGIAVGSALVLAAVAAGATYAVTYDDGSTTTTAAAQATLPMVAVTTVTPSSALPITTTLPPTTVATAPPTTTTIATTTTTESDTTIVSWYGQTYPLWEVRAAEAWQASGMEYSGLSRIAKLWECSDWVVKVVVGNALLTGVPSGGAGLLTSDDAQARAIGNQLFASSASWASSDAYGDLSAELARLAQLWHVAWPQNYDPKYLIGLRELAGKPVE